MLKRAGHTEAAVDLCPARRALPGRACSARSSTTTAPWPGCPTSSAFCREHGLRADLHRRPHPLPAPHREAGRSGSARPASPPNGATSPASPTGPSSTGPSTSPWSVATSPGTDDRAGAGALRVPDRRRVRLAALRLRGAARQRHGSIAEEGNGVLVYLRGHEGRGIGLGHKLRAYQLQEDGVDTVDANIAARPSRRQPRVRHRRADPRRPGRHHHAAAHQQPRRSTAVSRGSGSKISRAGAAHESRSESREHPLPAGQAGADGPPARPGSMTSPSPSTPSRFATLMTTIEGSSGAMACGSECVCGRFNDMITERLLAGARDGLVRHGVADDDITVVWVPGRLRDPPRGQATRGQRSRTTRSSPSGR